MDTSTLIGIIDELGRPDLIDSILKLGHTLAVPGHVKSELRSRETMDRVERMATQGKIRIFAGSTAAELRWLKKRFPGLDLGECDTLLLYGRVSPHVRSYCILDEKLARSAARDLGIPFTGLLGLLVLLKQRGIIGEREAGEIVEDLRDSGFWMPTDFVI